jgi:hypothetical protein
MKTLNEQFDYCMADVYERDKEQRLILAKLLNDYSHKTEFVSYVLARMPEFNMGDDGRSFFCRCADEMFKNKLREAIDKGGKRPESIKKFHPLFGESWWTT